MAPGAAAAAPRQQAGTLGHAGREQQQCVRPRDPWGRLHGAADAQVQPATLAHTRKRSGNGCVLHATPQAEAAAHLALQLTGPPADGQRSSSCAAATAAGQVAELCGGSATAWGLTNPAHNWMCWAQPPQQPPILTPDSGWWMVVRTHRLGAARVVGCWSPKTHHSCPAAWSQPLWRP